RRGIMPVGIKSIAGEAEHRQNQNDQRGRDFLLKTQPENARFDCGIGSWRGYRHAMIVDLVRLRTDSSRGERRTNPARASVLLRQTAFDAVLLVILASVLSRAINGSAAFFATLGGGLVLVLLHRLLAFIAFHSHWFGCLIKGRPELIIDDGDFVLSTMHRNHISTHDVEEDMR